MGVGEYSTPVRKSIPRKFPFVTGFLFFKLFSFVCSNIDLKLFLIVRCGRQLKKIYIYTLSSQRSQNKTNHLLLSIFILLLYYSKKKVFITHFIILIIYHFIIVHYIIKYFPKIK